MAVIFILIVMLNLFDGFNNHAISYKKIFLLFLATFIVFFDYHYVTLTVTLINKFF